MTDKRIIRLEADIPIECAYRKSDSFNALQTYPVPPVTTVRGMIYAAMGRPSLLNQHSKPYTPSKDIIDEEREFRDMFEKSTKIAIKAKSRGKTKTDLRNRMKVGRSGDDAQYKTYVAQEETIIKPKYLIYVECGDEDLFEDIKNSLEDPERLLYLGRSDDIVCLMDVSEKLYEESEVPDEHKILIPEETGDEPFLLPVRSDFKGTYTTRPAESKIVSWASPNRSKMVQVDGEKEYFEFID